MKNLIPKLTYVMCLTACGFANAQSSQDETSQVIDDQIFTSEPLVCKLTGPEFRKRLDELRTIVFAKVESYEELENGYVFKFEDDEDFLPKLMDYMLSERKCCPFFDFNLSVKSKRGGPDLTVSGPDGAKEMIEMMIE